MSHQYKTDDVIQLQVLCLLQKLLYLLPGKWHDDFKLDSRHRWRLDPGSLTTPNLSIYYLCVGGEGGQESKRKIKTHQLYFFLFPPFFFLKFPLSWSRHLLFHSAAWWRDNSIQAPKQLLFLTLAFMYLLSHRWLALPWNIFLITLIVLAKMHQLWKGKKRNLTAQNNRSGTAQTSHFPDQWSRYFVNQVLGMASSNPFSSWVVVWNDFFSPAASYFKITVKKMK